MGDPYRTDELPCPTCSAALRPFGQRLVCDHCHGMQIGAVDLGEQVGPNDDVVVLELVDTGAPCPRCGVPMRACALRVGTVRLTARFVYCATDGIWLAGGQLEGLLEAVGRAEHGSTGGARSYGGVGGLIRYHRTRPQVHTPPPPSAYRDRALACPACGTTNLALRGERWECDGCKGAFIENDRLEAFMQEMVAGPWSLAPCSGPDGARACPICTVALTRETLEGVGVDRCAGHGVWFDADELQAALQRA